MHSQSRKRAQSAQPAHQTSTPQSGVRHSTSNLHSIPEELTTVGTSQDWHQAFNLDLADQPIRGGISYRSSAPPAYSPGRTSQKDRPDSIVRLSMPHMTPQEDAMSQSTPSVDEMMDVDDWKQFQSRGSGEDRGSLSHRGAYEDADEAGQLKGEILDDDSDRGDMFIVNRDHTGSPPLSNDESEETDELDNTDEESEETIHQPQSYTPVSDVKEDIEEGIKEVVEEEGKEEDKNENEDNDKDEDEDEDDDEDEDNDEDKDERSVPVQPSPVFQSRPSHRVIRRPKGRASAAKVDAPRRRSSRLLAGPVVSTAATISERERSALTPDPTTPPPTHPPKRQCHKVFQTAQKSVGLPTGERGPLDNASGMLQASDDLHVVSQLPSPVSVVSNVISNSDVYCFLCQQGGDLVDCDHPNCGRAICLHCIPDLQQWNMTEQMQFECPACATKHGGGAMQVYHGLYSVQSAEKPWVPLTKGLQILGKPEISQTASYKPTRMLILIYTHSHDDTGDLFYSSHWVGTIDTFFKFVVCEDLMALSREVLTTFALLACGSVVSKAAPGEDLVTVCTRYKLPRVLAFTAPVLSSISAAPFFFGFVRRVFIEGATVGDLLMSELLASSGPLGRHSRVILLEETTQDRVISRGDATTGDLDKARRKRAWAESYKLTISEYIWDHPRISPYGNRVPMQCDTCLRLGTFIFFDRKGTSPQTHCYHCKHCHAEWSFEPPQDGRLLKEFNQGAWVKVIQQ
ncbi:hypothetical protein SCP_0901850 [Sparassis crispa]|uniref:Uncharacterized protein n=1 Tax=Sparassis crispa TaxID=139825 RepID=A0A401GVR6_9APHY|nr:hypothetical protein SCP_0901850 [Sparassis crispa]GBE86306.1 hypothetical protein SCP_0901850 [Sparassis crispa]